MNAVIEKKPFDYISKASKLKQEVEDAKKRYDQLLERRKKELGDLAFKAGLAELSDDILIKCFAEIIGQHHAKESA